MPRRLAILPLILAAQGLSALEYPHPNAEPQPSGWPLSAQERAYITDKPEYERRPGRELHKHLPQLWPQVPTAGHFGGDAWLRLHEDHVKTVQSQPGPLPVLLVGDSITIQWGQSWKKNFPGIKAINLGIGGDKTQNLLWRLDHGGVQGLEPSNILLMIGNNNAFFTPETGIEAAAKGVALCVANLREKFPKARIVLAKILPAHAPGNRFHEDLKQINQALHALPLENDPNLRLLDLWPHFTQADGQLRAELYSPDQIHLSPQGYALYAKHLRPLLQLP